MNGQSMQWAPKLTSLSWIRGSHHTTSSLSAPGSEAAVRALCAPQAYSCIAVGFCPSVSILDSVVQTSTVIFMKVFGDTEGSWNACVAAKLQTL